MKVALTASTLCALLAVASGQSYWPTARHDLLNSGISPLNGLDAAAVCPSTLYTLAGVEDPSRLYSTGVLTSDNKYLVFGDHANYVRFLPVADPEAMVSFYLGSGSLQGVAGDGVLAKLDGEDRFFVVSGNGVVNCLNVSACIAGAQDRCSMWNYTLPTSSLAPLRLIPTSGTDGRPWGTLIASATSNYTDDGGMLVALDAKAGTLIWTFRAHNVQDTDTHGIHYVPVVDSSRDSLIYIAFGSRIVALNYLTGVVVAQASGTDEDPFSSSPTLIHHDDASRLYVHSASGALWMAQITGGAGQGAVAISVKWSCVYREDGQDCCFPPLYCERHAVLADFIASSTPLTEEELQSPDRKGVQPMNLKDFGYLPYAAPALSSLEMSVYVNQLNLMIKRNGTVTGDRGLYAANGVTGDKEWGYFGVDNVYEESRSAVTISADGKVYTAYQAQNGVNTEPYIVCLEPHGASFSFGWEYRMGFIDDPIGSSSPVMGPDANGDTQVYMAVVNELVALAAGTACPTDQLESGPCSGHGTCDTCNGGVCHCTDKCWSGDDCATELQCGAFGTCSPATGTCACIAGATFNATMGRCMPTTCGNGTYNPTTDSCDCNGCFTGPLCMDLGTCNNNGTCNVNTGVCDCNECYSGDTCTVPNDCSGRGSCVIGEGCQCKFPFGGHNCADCQNCHYGDECENYNKCNGHGECNPANDKCNCVPDYGGETCTLCPLCSYGRMCSQLRTCNGHGRCSPVIGICHCDQGYAGENCDTCNVCYSRDSNHECTIPKDCGHGSCTDEGVCLCHDGFSGANCQNSDTNAGAIAAGILVPLGVIAAVGGFVYFRKRSGLPALPKMLQFSKQPLAKSEADEHELAHQPVTGGGGGYGAL